MKLLSYAFHCDPFKATDKSLTPAQPPVAAGGLRRAAETLERRTTATTWRREAAGTGASGASGHTSTLLIKLN